MRVRRLKKGIAFLLASMLTLTAASSITASASDNMETKIDQVLSKFTLRERARMKLGGVPGEPGQSTNIGNQTAAVAAKGLSYMNMSDGPMGVNANGAHTSFGSGMVIAATWNRDLVKEIGTVIGKESLAKDVQWFLAPAFNINRDLANGRTFEYYSEDPFLSAGVAVPYIQGVQSKDVLVTLKHFMANNQEKNRNFMSANVSERATHEIYLPAFEATVKADAWGVMTGANRMNGVFPSDNRYLLTNLTKYDFGLRGITLTDWINVRTGVISAKAGLDLAMPYSGGSYYTQLANYVRSGQLDERVVSESSKRMLRTAFLTKSMLPVEGVDLSGYLKTDRQAGELTSAANATVARRMADEGITLLKNNGNKLPIDKASVGKIALLGKYVNYEFNQVGLGGSGWTRPPYQITSLQGIQSKLGGSDKLIVPAYNESNMTTTISDAVAAAQQAEYAIVFAGLNSTSVNDPNVADTEDGDRQNLNFPSAQRDLIKAVAAANPNTVVVLNGSMFIVREWIDDVPAVLQTYYPGMEGGAALADILFGDVNPSGHLTNTWPKAYEETTGYIDPQGSGKSQYDLKWNDVDYKEGVYVGYRWYEKQNLTPEFCFGHGLSYTTFEYSNLRFSQGGSMGRGDTMTLSVDVRNAGSKDGKETVQFYLQDRTGAIDRPSKELKGYEKVLIPAGQTKTVTFEIDAKTLSYWDVDTHSFMAKQGSYTAHVGRSVGDIRIAGDFSLTESTLPNPDYMVLQESASTVQENVTAQTGKDVDGTNVGYMAFNRSSKLGWTVNAPTAGEYSIVLHYSNPNYAGDVTQSYGANKVTTLLVNGEEAGAFDFQNTRKATVWNYDSIDVKLNAGQNTITLVGTEASDDLRLDKLIVQKITRLFSDAPACADDSGEVPPPEESEDGAVYQFEKATQLNNARVTSNSPGYTGTGYVEFIGQNSSAELPFLVSTPVQYAFTLYYSNGSDQEAPMEVYIDGIKAYTLTLPPTGGATKWKFEQTAPIQMLMAGLHTMQLKSLSDVQVCVDKLIVPDGMSAVVKPPSVLSTLPLEGRVSNSIDGEILVYFSKPVTLTGAAAASLSNGEGGTIACTLSQEGATKVKILPSSELAAGKDYTLLLKKESVEDAGHLTLASDFTLTFKSARLSVTPADSEKITYTGTWQKTETGMQSSETNAKADYWFDGLSTRIVLSGNGRVEWKAGHFADGNAGKQTVDVNGTVTLDSGRMDGIYQCALTVLSGTVTIESCGVVRGSLIAPPLTNDGWIPSAYKTHATVTPGHALDGNLGTRWIAGEYQAPGQWYQIDFGKPTTVNALSIYGGATDYGRGYQIMVSDDELIWTTVSTGRGTAEYTTARFPVQTARYVRIQLTESNNAYWWALHMIYVFHEQVEDLEPPAPPEYLYSEAYNRQINLRWWGASDNLGVTGYVVYRDGTEIGRTYQEFYLDTDILSDQSYTYTVRALDEAGNESELSSPCIATADSSKTLLPRDNWTATAFAAHDSHPSVLMIDADPLTRWCAGTGMQSGQWVMLDMGAKYRFNQIEVLSNATDYLTAYTVQVSDNGTSWTTVKTGTDGKPNQMFINIPQDAAGRYIRLIYNGGNRGDWWSIFDLNVRILTPDISSDSMIPTGLRAEGFNRQIHLRWNEPTLALGIKEYSVLRDGEEIGRTTNLVYMDTAAIRGESYTYTVQAVSYEGDKSSLSNAITAQTDVSKTRLSRQLWKATASHMVASPETASNDAPQFVFDGNPSTRWTSLAPQNVGMWFYVDMGASYTLNNINLLGNNDFPVGYALYVSQDGENWGTPIASGAGAAPSFDITFPPVTARYLRLVSTVNAPTSWWSINELNVDLTAADTTQLTAFVIKADALTEDDYVPASWAALSAALSGARQILDNAGASQTEIDGAAASLRIALDGLQVKVPATGVTLSDTALTLHAGGASKTLAATVTPESATNKTVTWLSSDEAVATVDENGTVTAIYPGEATITVTTADSGFTATCTVTVTAKYAVTVATGETIAVPITVEGVQKLSGLRGEISYDDSLLSLNAITAKKGWLLTSEGNTFVALTGDGMGIDDTAVIGYAVFTAQADLLDDITTYVSFPSRQITAFDESLEATGALIPTVGVSIAGIAPMPGDVSLDGETDLADAILLMQYLAGSRTLTARQLKAADVNRDGKINVGDAAIIMQMCL